jgi:hypothetical protein
MSDAKMLGAAALEPETRVHEESGPDPSALSSGTRVGAFIIEAVLGSGGFGITYLARHETLKKQFALKEYFPHQFAYRDTTNVHASATAVKDYAWGLDRFVKEAQALAKFKHPAIVDVSDIFTANNTAYMVLAYENAPSLGEWLERLQRHPTQNELDRIVTPLLDALELVHRYDMLHRDIAPDNILVRPDGTPVLIDFGAARDDLQHRAGPITAVIKPGYSPPEQYERDASRQGPWSDIYGFGATLYFAVVGDLPVDAENRFDARVRTEAVKRARGIYRSSFLQAIDWAMEFHPAARPQSVAEWRTQLFAHEPAETRKLAGSPRQSRTTVWLPSTMPISLGAAAVIAVCALALPVLLWPCQIVGFGCSAAIVHPAGPGALKLNIALPKKTYAVGDNLTFSVKSNRDCYFLVYTVSPSGEVEQHDPAQNHIFMGSEMLKADQWRELPVQGFATIKPPAGNFELGAVCSKEPLATIGLSDAQLSEPARAGRRSFSFALDNATKGIKRDDFARTTVEYEVRQ